MESHYYNVDINWNTERKGIMCSPELNKDASIIKIGQMKERILIGWTFARMIYVAMGGLIITQSILEKQWFGIAARGYFAAMGLSAFGCAAGNCVGGNCTVEPAQKSKTVTQEFRRNKSKIKWPKHFQKLSKATHLH